VKTFKQAILDTAAHMLPFGYDVSDDAPQSFEQLNALLTSGGRMCVWSGGSTNTIYEDAKVNYAFRAWHDLCHWWGAFPFTVDGEIETCEMQCRQLVHFYGDNDVTRSWCAVLRAEVIGQAEYFERHKRFPDNQTAFVTAYMADLNDALQWPLW
jgi:hypothetical protein